MTGKMREEFEAWWIETEFGGSRDAAAHWLTRYEDAYHYRDPAQAWKAWQASRAALVVALPSCVDAKPYASYESGWNDMRGEAVDAIEAAGGRVKP
ncbi:hypothetical protein [Pseudomonas fluorescens]|uniref:Uncharacterized protein n=1 Tax=Pseudomonas fluorescens TaxID=294 RepID=A0A0D0MM02_PSEFL|nr:hypothetical protein [Pseudomonas fluorescens]KIQ56455.1 hypothetical protein RL74_25940 [Pseudomonas fluorescens]